MIIKKNMQFNSRYWKILSVKFQKSITLFLLVLFLFTLISCNDENNNEYEPKFTSPPNQVNEYIFGVHPLHNPKRLQEIFGPLIDYLTEKIPNVIFRLEASRNYAAFDKKLYEGKFHFALPNPFQTVNSLDHNYHVFGKMSDDKNFRGIIILRKDSKIKSIKELKGKAISFPAPTALAATMMPQYYLEMNGIEVMKDIDIKYVGSQESSIMSVYLGNTDAASTWPPPWLALIKERPELDEELEVKWETKPLINNGLVVRNDVSKKILEQVSELILNLHTHPKGRLWLERMELSKFEKANDETYSVVIEFLKKFNREVREINFKK